jgi:hypothetical protein
MPEVKEFKGKPTVYVASHGWNWLISSVQGLANWVYNSITPFFSWLSNSVWGFVTWLRDRISEGWNWLSSLDYGCAVLLEDYGVGPPAPHAYHELYGAGDCSLACQEHCGGIFDCVEQNEVEGHRCPGF